MVEVGEITPEVRRRFIAEVEAWRATGQSVDQLLFRLRTMARSAREEARGLAELASSEDRLLRLRHECLALCAEAGPGHPLKIFERLAPLAGSVPIARVGQGDQG